LTKPNSNVPRTLGIEFESIILTKEEMQILTKSGFLPPNTLRAVTRDASVESTKYVFGRGCEMFGGNRMIRNSFGGNLPTQVMGYELVTYPLEIAEMREAIIKIVNLQVRYGEIFSKRSSIHVHTGFPNALIFHKTALALGLKVEPLFYKIAGMGNEYRGVINNSAYCRPLALPPAAPLSDSSKQAILDPLGAIEADSTGLFWGKMGIREGDTDRYNPLRYFGINIFSTLIRGTLEFRFFNFCTVSKYVCAVTSLCRLVSDIMQRTSFQYIDRIPQVSIFEENPEHVYHSILDSIVEMGYYYDVEFPMDQDDINIIKELIYNTPQPVFRKAVISSHVKTGRISMSDARRFGLEIVNNAEPANILDIHNFENSDHCLLESD
jgi:hypothetical protein